MLHVAHAYAQEAWGENFLFADVFIYDKRCSAGMEWLACLIASMRACRRELALGRGDGGGESDMGDAAGYPAQWEHKSSESCAMRGQTGCVESAGVREVVKEEKSVCCHC